MEKLFRWQDKIVSRELFLSHHAATNLVRMWYCGDVPSNIPPYKILRKCYISHLKHGKCKLSQMKKLMDHVEWAASIVNKTHLVRNDCTAEHAFELYNAVMHLFFFDSIKAGKRRRYESIPWKTYYNNLPKQKYKLLGEVGLAGVGVLVEVGLAGAGVH